MGEHGESSVGVESAGWAATDMREEGSPRDWSTAWRDHAMLLRVVLAAGMDEAALRIVKQQVATKTGRATVAQEERGSREAVCQS